MRGKALVLVALMACTSSVRPPGVSAQVGGNGAELQSGDHKWRDTAMCGLSMLVPAEMRYLTVQTCARAIAAWIE